MVIGTTSPLPEPSPSSPPNHDKPNPKGISVYSIELISMFKMTEGFYRAKIDLQPVYYQRPAYLRFSSGMGP